MSKGSPISRKLRVARRRVKAFTQKYLAEPSNYPLLVERYERAVALLVAHRLGADLSTSNKHESPQAIGGDDNERGMAIPRTTETGGEVRMPSTDGSFPAQTISSPPVSGSSSPPGPRIPDLQGEKFDL